MHVHMNVKPATCMDAEMKCVRMRTVSYEDRQG